MVFELGIITPDNSHNCHRAKKIGLHPVVMLCDLVPIPSFAEVSDFNWCRQAHRVKEATKRGRLVTSSVHHWTAGVHY